MRLVEFKAVQSVQDLNCSWSTQTARFAICFWFKSSASDLPTCNALSSKTVLTRNLQTRSYCSKSHSNPFDSELIKFNLWIWTFGFELLNLNFWIWIRSDSQRFHLTRWHTSAERNWWSPEPMIRIIAGSGCYKPRYDRLAGRIVSNFECRLQKLPCYLWSAVLCKWSPTLLCQRTFGSF